MASKLRLEGHNRWKALYRRDGGAELTKVMSSSARELQERRNRILDEHGMSLEVFRARADDYALVGTEWEAWESLRSIQFLLDDD